MNLSVSEKKRRRNSLVLFYNISGIKFLLHRFHSPDSWASEWYGVPDFYQTYEREFPIHPKGKEALGRSVDILKKLGWDEHIVCILTGGANVDRQQRGSSKPSPHSIEYGTFDEQKFATAIDIGGVIWDPGEQLSLSQITSYVADRSAKAREIGVDIFDPGRLLIPDNKHEVMSIVPAHDTPYVVLACVFSQFFGTVLHDKCSGYTGKIHRDHMHLDCVRPVGYRGSNSQNTLIQMALNLFAPDKLKVDGKIGINTAIAWGTWSRMYLDKGMDDDINVNWKELMAKVPALKG